MGQAGGVQHQAGGRVGRDDRCKVLQRPERQSVQGFGIADRIGPGAPVSTPLTWSQVKKGLDPASYTVRTVPALVRKPMAWEDYCDGERPPANAIKRLGKV